jgi:homoserine dehydrogenase
MAREGAGRLALRDISEVEARYYIRMQAVDKPGVLAKIAGVLGGQNISIASAIQTERKQLQSVPLVIVTHVAREGAVQAALAEISRLDVITGKHVILREEE